MDKRIIKYGDIEIEIRKFHQHEILISIKNIDINETAVSNKASFGKKKVLNISLVTKMLKIDLDVYISQK